MNSYTPLDPILLAQLTGLFSKGSFKTVPEELQKYAHDETEDLVFLPEAVFIPDNTDDVSRLLSWCTLHNVPVVARGAGTGLSGGALPVHKGIIISFERMNQLIELDERNQQATVQPGMITEVFMKLVEEKSLYYPVDPASKGSCYLGGNVATCSGGPRVVKYGSIREYVLNLEVVLADGSVIWTGANTIKYASGYNLTQLMIGSEGTLGVITAMVLKLIPRPKTNILLLAAFTDAATACQTVSAIFRNGFTPSALEFMEREAVDWVLEHELFVFKTDEITGAYLLIELDGTTLETLQIESEQLAEIIYAAGSHDIMLADTAAQKESWWQLRRSMATSVKSHSVYKEEDTVVPRAELAKLLEGIKSIGRTFNFKSVCYGHAGDGNMHVNIIRGDMSDFDWNIRLKEGIKEIFALTVSLGGTLSGEHGIGWVQKEYMQIKFAQVNIDLMKGIKAVFDPQNILNPGKIFN